MDLVDLSPLSKYNDKYKYLLHITDIFSSFAWSVPLKDKTGKSIAAAVTTLFQNRKPITKQSDKASEFVNAIVLQYLKRHGVDLHTTHNPDRKGGVIERFNRALKTKMYKYYTKNNTYRYLDVIKFSKKIQQRFSYLNRHGPGQSVSLEHLLCMANVK
jgi:transposase InsO family protein